MGWGAHRRALELDGFVQLKGALPPVQVHAAQGLARQTLKALAASERDRVKSNGSMANLARLPIFAELVAAPQIIATLQNLGGSDPRWTGGYLISKPPGGPPLFWHQDWWGWDEDLSYAPKGVQLFVMIYLTATEPRNGCLRVIPGSHRQRHDLHQIMDAHSAALVQFKDPDAAAYSRHEDEVAIHVEPGDLVIGDSRLIHGAYANTSREERPLITLWYAPDFGALPATIRARYSRMMADQDSDIDESSLGGLTPFEWPEPARSTVAGLLPDREAACEPTPWRRNPDLTRLSA